jgi:hypothetical protein
MQATTSRSGKQPILATGAQSQPIIGRIWFGRTRADLADEYRDYLYEHGVLPVEAKPGCLGMQMFRQIKGDVAEFTTISYWRSMDDMRHMHKDGGDLMRPSHLPKDPEYLLELPERVEITELYANDWQLDT